MNWLSCLINETAPDQTRFLAQDELHFLKQYQNWEGRSKAARSGIRKPDVFIQYGPVVP